jgi:hypothetical protein
LTQLAGAVRSKMKRGGPALRKKMSVERMIFCVAILDPKSCVHDFKICAGLSYYLADQKDTLLLKFS